MWQDCRHRHEMQDRRWTCTFRQPDGGDSRGRSPESDLYLPFSQRFTTGPGVGAGLHG